MNKDKNRIPTDMMLLTIFAIIIFALFSAMAMDLGNKAGNGAPADKQKAQTVVETKNGTRTDESHDGIRMIAGKVTVHEYEDITVTKDDPLMGFNNPIENEDLALLRYTVDADYDSEDPVPLIQEEMWVLPGKTLPIDVHTQLDPGVYSVRISILAMDPVTDEELGADVQYITVTVE